MEGGREGGSKYYCDTVLVPVLDSSSQLPTQNSMADLSGPQADDAITDQTKRTIGN